MSLKVLKGKLRYRDGDGEYHDLDVLQGPPGPQLGKIKEYSLHFVKNSPMQTHYLGGYYYRFPAPEGYEYNANEIVFAEPDFDHGLTGANLLHSWQTISRIDAAADGILVYFFDGLPETDIYFRVMVVIPE